ncbi:MAG: hypothetical protein AAGC56_00265 [Pseudomonadota bacterium]
MADSGSMLLRTGPPPAAAGPSRFDAVAAAFAGEAWEDWWRTDYSVDGLRQRGEFDLYEKAGTPIFSFAGKQWTALHMPLCARDGTPSPKLLMAVEHGRIYDPDTMLGMSRIDLRRLVIDACEGNDACVDYFTNDDSPDNFAQSLNAVLDAATGRTRLDGLVCPCDIKINGPVHDMEEGPTTTFAFNRCSFFGEARFEDASFDLLQFFECTLSDDIKFNRCRIDALRFFRTGYNSRFATNKYYKRMIIYNSTILDIYSSSSGFSIFVVESSSVKRALSFNEHCGSDLELFIAGKRSENCSVGDVSIRELPAHSTCEPFLSILHATVEGVLDIDARMNNAQFVLRNCTIVGPIDASGAKLHPGSNFTNVALKISPKEFVQGKINRRKLFMRMDERLGWGNEDRPIDAEAEATRYVNNVENGFRHLRKLAKDNRQTDYELLFYQRQFEARTKRRDVPLTERRFLRLYRLISKYGTSLERPPLWLAAFATLCFAAALAATWGAGAELRDAYAAASWAASQALPQTPPPLNDLGAPSALAALAAGHEGVLYAMIVAAKVVSFTLVALFVIALRRRFQID